MRSRLHQPRSSWVLAAVMVVAASMSWSVQARQDAEATTPADPGPRTGSDWIDLRLRDMDAYAARYRDAFVDEIVRYHAAPRDLVDEALDTVRMPPGEAYFACALAQATGRACRELVDAWRSDHADGWQGIATRLGVDMDAAMQRRIREQVTQSYARWARPLDMATPSPER